MKWSYQQRAWIISIGVHMVALLSISIPLSTQVKDPADIYVPIHIQMIEKKQKQRVDAKKLVSNVGPPTAKKKAKANITARG